MSEDRLTRDVFIALSAIGWADGKLDPEEADAIVRTALEEGLELEEIAEIEESTKHPVKLDAIACDGMSAQSRLFVYAVAGWIAGLCDGVHGAELTALVRLGDALGLPPRARERAEAIALEIAALPEGDRPHRYDLKRLREALAHRLAGVLGDA